MSKGHVGILAFLLVGILILGIAIVTTPKQKPEEQQKFTVTQNYEVTFTVDGRRDTFYTYGEPLCNVTEIEFKCISIGGPNITVFLLDWGSDTTVVYSASAKAGVSFTQTSFSQVVDKPTYDWYNAQVSKYTNLKAEWDKTNK